MNKKNITSKSDNIVHKLKVLAKKKENVRSKLAVTAEELRLKAKKLAVTAKEKENVRQKLEVTAEELAMSAKEKEDVRQKLEITAEALKITAKEKEDVRQKLEVTAEELKLKAKQLAVTAKEKESVRRKLAVTAEKLNITAKKKEDVRQKLEVTAEALKITAKEKEDVRRKLAVTAKELKLKAKLLAVTAKEKESVRRKLEITAEALKITAKEKEDVRQKLEVTANELKLKAKLLAMTANEKEDVRRKLAVTAKELAVTAKEKESVRRKLAVTAEELKLKAKQLAVTAKEKEDVRRKLAVTAEELAVTAKEKENVRQKLAVTAEELKLKAKQLAVTAKEKEDVRRKLEVTAGELKATAKEKETMFASIGDGLLATDEKGNITLINVTAEILLGKKSAEVMGKAFFEVIPIEDEKGNAILLEKNPVSMALSTGTTTTTTTTTTGTTYYYAHKDTTKFPVAITVTPVILDAKVIGTIEVFRDITREKEIDKAKSEFISIASHQLKTPPTAIKLLTERLLSGKMGNFNQKQKEYVDDIRSSNQRMIDLVNALLNVSRIELGAFTIKVSEKDTLVMIQSILDELKPIINKEQLKLRAVFPQNDTKLMLDEPLFRMVIGNLITNSIHYTAKGGEIKVECKEVEKGQTLGGKLLEEDCFVVMVSDTGYGIPQDQQSKVFTKFFRADNAREKHTDGTGLGLYIVKSILDHSGGLIWYTSHENEGSVFYVAVPMTGMRVKLGKIELISL
jgi:PAS domain S-box-containing protein